MSVGRAVAALVLAVTAAGCTSTSGQRGYEYMPDMTVSVPYDTFARNRVTRSGMTQQLPVRGTIPRGFLPIHYAKTPEDAERAGRELSFPQPPDAKTVEQGRQLYETFCAVCHGLSGDGDGPLVPLIPNPPAYWSEHVRAMPAGHLFHVVTFGSGRMPAYASQVAVADRWSIVAYVQTLQRRHAEAAP